MENYRSVSVFSFTWFFTRILILDGVIIFLSFLLLDYLNLVTSISLICLLVFALIIFVASVIFSILWNQNKEIEKDDKNFVLENQ
ncbi:MAG: hypothetical protein Athens071416_46 [Parcubacteria group bacterium Athens0714_16]|nr:MAG: hypothetical protein Athens071416_46 [Parcubacteria group bacterium Athens0714_16]